MAKFFKKFFAVICLLLLIPLSFVAEGEKSYADTNSDYIKYTIMVKEDGKVSQSIIISASLPSSYNVLTREALKVELKALLTQDLNQKKAEITAKYLEENIEEYNPESQIIFGDNGQAVSGTDYVGYAIEYSSLNVFKYYNNIQTSYKKGFLTDKSSQILDNPFNDPMQVGNTTVTVADYYKSMYLTACSLRGIEKEYSPYYYNDYMTLSARTKSTADSVVQDADNYYHHMWVSDGVFLNGDDEMKLSLNIIHAGWWYLFGTAIPLVVMGGAIVVVKILNKSKKSGKKNNENIRRWKEYSWRS